jgi:hypothetical protein
MGAQVEIRRRVAIAFSKFYDRHGFGRACGVVNDRRSDGIDYKRLTDANPLAAP